MPWQLSDVNSHCAGLSDKRKQVWVAVANGVLAECLKNGGTDKTCAPKAIRIANSRAKGANHKEVARMANSNLSEVGKTISAATAAKLKSAMAAMKTAMGEMEGLMPMMDGEGMAAEAETPAEDPPAEEAAVDVEMAGEFVPLLEAALRSDGSVPIKIIQPGQGSSGWYSPEVLKRDGPNVFKAGLKGYVDHPTESEIRDRPERSVKDLALELTTNAHYDTEGAAGPGLYAEAKVYKPWQQFVSDMAPHIGLSIRATGKARDGEIDGKSTKIIEELVSAKSVDLVTVPGAGGKILQLFESARERVETAVQTEAAQGRDSNKGVSAMEETQKVTALETALAEAKAETARVQAVVAEHEKAALKRDAASIVASVFAEAKVSPPEVLAAKLTATAPIKEGKLDADAFRTEVKAIAESMKPAATGGEIKGMGSGSAAEAGAADDPAAHKALVESFERRFLNQGKKPEIAKQLAETAARGR